MWDCGSLSTKEIVLLHSSSTITNYSSTITKTTFTSSENTDAATIFWFTLDIQRQAFVTLCLILFRTYLSWFFLNVVNVLEIQFHAAWSSELLLAPDTASSDLYWFHHSNMMQKDRVRFLLDPWIYQYALKWMHKLAAKYIWCNPYTGLSGNVVTGVRQGGESN